MYLNNLESSIVIYLEVYDRVCGLVISGMIKQRFNIKI